MSRILVLLTFSLSGSVFAEPASETVSTASDDETIQTQNSSYLDGVKKRQSEAPGTPYESVDKENLPEHEERWSDFLPFLGKEAREQGYVLPLPFGVSLIGLVQEQPFSVDKIGLSLNGTEYDEINQVVDDSINARDLTVSDQTFNLRFDAWILPFWNVYGLAGRTEGTAELVLDVQTNIPSPSPGNTLFCDVLGLPSDNVGGNIPIIDPPQYECVLNYPNLPVKLDFHGDLLGYGTTIAGGYGDFFGMFDVNYSEADINISRDKSKQTVYSGRIGWSGKMGYWNGQMWVGGMKQDIEQTLNIILPDVPIEVVIDQSASSPYNYLVGGSWNISQHWQVILESSFLFSDRQQFMAQLSYRM